MKKGQALWEFVLLLAVLAGLFIWIDFKKQAETNNIASGAKQTNVADKKYGLINDINFLNFGGRIAKIEPEKAVVSSPVITPVVVEPTLSESLGLSKIQIDSIGKLSSLERLGLDIVIILVVMIVGGLLDAIGGDVIIEMRRFVMPALVGAGISTIVYSFYPLWYSWMSGLLILPAMGTLTLGYMNGSNFGRGLWLFVQASLGFGLLLTLYSIFFHVPLLAWWLYIIYAVIAGIGGGTYKNLKQFLGDWLTGSLCLCSIIFWVFVSLQFKL